MKKQQDFIYKLLIKQGKISRNFALSRYISRLSSIIHRLRHEKGLSIGGTYVPNKNGRDYVYFLIN